MKTADLSDPIIKENRDEIARLAGFNEDEIAQMTPMRYSDANGGNVNAQTGKGIDTAHNCQICVVVFEARCRGINVTAQGFVDNGFIKELANNQTLAYLTKENTHPELTAMFYNREELTRFLTSNEMAKNGRYQLGINRWINEDEDGHILNVIRAKGETYLYDGQKKIRIEISDFIEEIDFSQGVELLRVDKLRFAPEVAQLFARR